MQAWPSLEATHDAHATQRSKAMALRHAFRPFEAAPQTGRDTRDFSAIASGVTNNFPCDQPSFHLHMRAPAWSETRLYLKAARSPMLWSPSPRAGGVPGTVEKLPVAK